MSNSPKRKLVICAVTFWICLSLLVTQSFSLSNEQVASRRQSMRDYTSGSISRQQLLDVLWAAYGYTDGRGNVPRIGYDYSLVLFTVNGTGSYRYSPESNSLAVHDLSVNKETIRPHDSDWPSDASEVLVIVWDESRMSNHYFAAAEAGCLAQNVYLAAASLDLGTCLVGLINSGGLRTALKLTGTLRPLFVMPLGYSTEQYPSASPEYSIMDNNLPPVQYSQLSFEDSIRNMAFVQQWSAEPLSLQKLSQLLWAAYGYSTADHRTTPSAYGIYPLVVYVSNATGVYRYLPESHSVTQTVSGDKRVEIANTFSGQVWAADAPAMFLIAYDSTYGGDGGFLSHLFVEADIGCVIQQLFLEAAAWNLEANIVSQGFEEWGGAGEQQLRSILGLPDSVTPRYAIPVGVPEGADSTPPTIGVPLQDPDSASVEPDQSVTVSVEVTDEGAGVSSVVLSYSVDGGQTWIDTTMSSVSANTYSGEIPGFEEDQSIQYKILAYDNADNLAIEDNAGGYYIYTVISEFQNFLILMFIASTLLAVILTKTRNKQKRL
jgi:hypothetical protein